MLKEKTNLAESLPRPTFLKELAQMIAEEKLASRGAKDLLALLVKNKESNLETSPLELAEKNNLLQISDEKTLSPIVESIISNEKNAKSIADYKGGKEQALMALVGQVIKETNGRANPTITKSIFIEKLK
jgi:aspartyl-tRNA(Asn)/glutamyl-tRNA(Gln) amidotransferase subunit B